MFLLDTTTVSDYLRGNKQVIANLHIQTPKNISVSSITKYEIEYGLTKKPSLRGLYQEQLAEFYYKTHEMPVDGAVAITAAAIKHMLIREGNIINVADILIAATAFCSDLTVVTSNVKDFSRIKGLPVIDWKV